MANLFLRLLFRVHLNDFTNAFKAYRRTVIEGCRRSSRRISISPSSCR